MDENKNPLKKLFERSAIGLAVKLIKEIWENHRKAIYVDLMITLLIAATVVGYAYEQSLVLRRSVRYFSWGGAIAGAFTKMLPLTVILFIFFNYMVYRVVASLHKETDRDSERNYDASHEGYDGTAHEMTPKERDEVFISGDYHDLNDIIIGADKDNIMKMYSLDTTVYGINRNIIIFGAPGSGKSRCYGIPILMQKIRLGESCIVTDPKGELYRETAAMAKAHGYVVKILNFKPENMLHSDTCDYMSVIGSKTYVAQSFSKTVMDNTNDGKISDFWTDSEFNLLIGLSLLITTGNGFMGMPKNLASAYNILNTNTVDSFEEMTSTLPDIHPAKPFLNTWANGDKTVKGNTFAGLQIRLASLAMPVVQRLCSTPDIDLTLPGKQKCIYFIGSSDTDKSMSFLVALFITLLCNALVSLADSTDEGYLPVRVTLLLDELANIGRIPDYTEKLSTFRGRHIDIISILQDLGQLQKMYPDNEWDTIMNDCHVKIVLRANNKTTSDYFSDQTGPQTVEDKGKRYTEKAGQLFKIHTEYQITESHKERPLYTPHEIRTLNRKYVLVFVSGENCIKMQKIDYSNHPMCRELRKWPATKHAPNWILNMPESERLEFGVYNEKYRKEYYDDIQLCTDEDFRHPWTEADNDELKKYIEEYAKKREKKKKSGTAGQTERQPEKTDHGQNRDVKSQPNRDLKHTVTATDSAYAPAADISSELSFGTDSSDMEPVLASEVRHIKESGTNSGHAASPDMVTAPERTSSITAESNTDSEWDDLNNAGRTSGGSEWKKWEDVPAGNTEQADGSNENVVHGGLHEKNGTVNRYRPKQSITMTRNSKTANTPVSTSESNMTEVSQTVDANPDKDTHINPKKSSGYKITAPEPASESDEENIPEESVPDMSDIPDIGVPDFSDFDDLGFSDDELMMDNGLEDENI